MLSIHFVRRFALPIIIQIISVPILAQQIQSHKLSISLKEMLSGDRKMTVNVVLAVKDQGTFLIDNKKSIDDRSLIILHRYDPASVFIISGSVEVVARVLHDGNVVFADKLRIPKEELLIGNYDLGTNKVNTVHHYFPAVNGEGKVVSIKEHRPDTNDIDLKGRYFSTPLTSNTYSPHASAMATVAAGAGNSFYQGKGAAWGTGITSSSFTTLLPDSDASYIQYNVTVQNHSYGTAIENYYGADARAYDQSMISNNSLLHIFSAGNSGSGTSNSGIYSGMTGVANLTGSFKMAKNVITVGHIDSLGNVLPASSRGPAHDGRVKPEVVAFGEDGSSGAAALTSGIVLLLQHAYKNLYGSLPKSSIIKSILFNSADDVDSVGVDYRSGYGSVNAFKAMRAIFNADFDVGSVAHNDQYTYTITLSPQTRRIKVTLNWNDPPAAANSAKALVNDLDMELVHISSGTVWKPWVLNHSPHFDSLRLLPVRKTDTLNTTEQVSVDMPPAGVYEIRVKGRSVNTASQEFAIAWQLDTINTFRWFYPTGSDNIFPGDTNILRWESNYTIATGNLEYSLNGINWTQIASVDLKKGFFQWTVPPITGLALLRMNIGTASYLTDTVIITRPPQLKVGFSCPDSLHLFWNPDVAADAYELFVLGDRFLEPLRTVTDTFVTIAPSTGTHFAIAPVINNKVGVRSLTIDHRNQGVGCYVKNFLAYLNGSSGYLVLELGTNYRITSIVWQKQTISGGFFDLDTITNITGVNFAFTDPLLKTGLNRYRAKITLSTGTVIYSNIETVAFLGEMEYLVFPNPIQHGSSFTLLAKEPGEIQVRILNTAGQPMKEVTTNDSNVVITTESLARGVYFVQVVSDGRQTGLLKLVVY